MFDKIIEPISEQEPAGEYLKGNRQLYRGYRNAFNVAQSSFRQLIESPDALEDAQAVKLNTDNWIHLRDECLTCLTQHSKDVEIYSWFTMAQLFTNDPFNNLAGALSTLEEVVITYWSELQPTLPEKKRKGSNEAEQEKEVVEHRIKPLLQLVGDTADSGLLYMPLQMLPLVSDIDYSRFFSAEKNGTLAQLKEEAGSVFVSEKSEITDKLIALGQIQHSLESLDKTISEQCFNAGVHPISFRFVKESVDRLISAIRYLVGDYFAHWPLDSEPEATPEPEPVQETQPSGQQDSAGEVNNSTSGQIEPGVNVAAAPAVHMTSVLNAGTAISNREQALAELQKIADYFLQSEPHSPIYLLLKRAVRWGGMSLPELLEELVGDNSAVHQRIEQMAGLESAKHEAKITPPDDSFLVQEVIPEVKETEQEKQNSSSTSDSPSSGLAQIEW